MYSTFSVHISLISFSYLITLDRTSNKMLNRSGKNEYPCFVPDLGRKTSRCSLLSMLLPVGFYRWFMMMTSFNKHSSVTWGTWNCLVSKVNFPVLVSQAHYRANHIKIFLVLLVICPERERESDEHTEYSQTYTNFSTAILIESLHGNAGETFMYFSSY